MLFLCYNLRTIKNRSLFFGLIASFFSLVILTGVIVYGYYLRNNTDVKNTGHEILGIVSTPSPTLTPSPTIVPYAINLISASNEIMEGSIATFTWNISGPPKTIHTTAIYYGSISSSAAFGNQIIPTDTRYTNVLKDFIKGDYLVPLQFVANEKHILPGTYFFRAYAQVDELNLWTEEKTFTVKPAPKYEIKVINYPAKVSPGENASFTWEIHGPDGETGFTAIVASKESMPGPLDTQVSVSNMSYKVIVNDFTGSKSQVPLRFIGNTKMQEPGIYYFRAFANINGKNIWSDEYSFTVE